MFGGARGQIMSQMTVSNTDKTSPNFSRRNFYLNTSSVTKGNVWNDLWNDISESIKEVMRYE